MGTDHQASAHRQQATGRRRHSGSRDGARFPEASVAVPGIGLVEPDHLSADDTGRSFPGSIGSGDRLLVC